MSTIDENVQHLIINTMTQEMFNSITPSDTELYMITDAVLSSSDIISALGYTPYDGTTNPNGYIIGISSNDVIAALGYTPENSANLVTTISSASTDTTYPSAKAVYEAIQASPGGATSLENLTDVSITSVAQGETLVYDSAEGKWKNSSVASSMSKFSATNPSLTANSGTCTWDIANTIGSKRVQVNVYELANYKEVIVGVSATDSTISVELTSSSDIPANSYEAIIIG